MSCESIEWEDEDDGPVSTEPRADGTWDDGGPACIEVGKDAAVATLLVAVREWRAAWRFIVHGELP